MDEHRLFAFATQNRLLAADMLEALTPQEWRTPSLCTGWTVREVAAHLVPPAGSFLAPRLLLGVLRYRGDLDRMVDSNARRDADRWATEQIIGLLRARSDVRLAPPVTGAGGPFTDTCIHLRDMARPLGLPATTSLEAWREALEFLTSPQAGHGFVPKRRVAELRFTATDQDWRWGEGAEVRGPSEALAMAISGRGVALADLEGDGQHELAARLWA